MSHDNEEGKLFVGGLAWNTSSEKLKDYFSQWGEVTDCVLMKDKITGNSRGFGFVTYENPDSVKSCLQVGKHSIDDKTIDPKPCTPKGLQQQKKQAAFQHTQTHKIFVGGIPKDAVENDLQTYFERFGTVNEVVFVINKDDNRHKGFGFVTFDAESSVEAALAKHYHEIKGKNVEAKRAQPREKMAAGRPGMDKMHNNGDSNGSSWGASAYGYGMPSGGAAQGNWGQMAGAGNMGYGGSSYGYGTGGGNFPATSYPGSYGGGYSGYGYGYGSQAMGYTGGVGANGKADGTGAASDAKGGSYGATGGYGGQASGYGPVRGGYGGGNDYTSQSTGNSYNTSNGGDASAARSGQNFHPYRR